MNGEAMIQTLGGFLWKADLLQIARRYNKNYLNLIWYYSNLIISAS